MAWICRITRYAPDYDLWISLNWNQLFDQTFFWLISSLHTLKLCFPHLSRKIQKKSILASFRNVFWKFHKFFSEVTKLGIWKNSITFTYIKMLDIIFLGKKHGGNLGNSWKKFRIFQMSGNLGNYLEKFPGKRNLGIFQIPLMNLSRVYFQLFVHFHSHGNLGNFPKELGNIPDIWEFW